MEVSLASVSSAGLGTLVCSLSFARTELWALDATGAEVILNVPVLSRSSWFSSHCDFPSPLPCLPFPATLPPRQMRQSWTTRPFRFTDNNCSIQVRKLTLFRLKKSGVGGWGGGEEREREKGCCSQ